MFENTSIFGFTAEQGDDYDHIVPLVGYASSHPITDEQVYDDDQLTMTDNDDLDQSVSTSPLTFKYAKSSFVFDRIHQPNSRITSTTARTQRSRSSRTPCSSVCIRLPTKRAAARPMRRAASARTSEATLPRSCARLPLPCADRREKAATDGV